MRTYRRTVVGGSRQGRLEEAIALYQRLGFRIVEIHVDAVDQARRIKPEIPEIGHDGIPIHDEIVLELKLQPYSHPAGADSGESGS